MAIKPSLRKFIDKPAPLFENEKAKPNDWAWLCVDILSLPLKRIHQLEPEGLSGVNLDLYYTCSRFGNP